MSDPHMCPKCDTTTWADVRVAMVRCRYCGYQFKVSPQPAHKEVSET
jgi:ribosomal protein L37AE/L43A